MSHGMVSLTPLLCPHVKHTLNYAPCLFMEPQSSSSLRSLITSAPFPRPLVSGRLFSPSQTMSTLSCPLRAALHPRASNSSRTFASCLREVCAPITSPLHSEHFRKLSGSWLALPCVSVLSVHTSLKSIHEVLLLERERLMQAWTGPDLRQCTSDQLASLCTTLSEVRAPATWPHHSSHVTPRVVKSHWLIL